MIPYKTIFKIDRNSKLSVYVQLTNQFIDLIKNGTLPANAKLPGSRTLAELIGLHRKTVIACYEELTMQGWVDSIPQKGTFVNGNIPMLQQIRIGSEQGFNRHNHIGFEFNQDPLIDREPYEASTPDALSVNDGISDSRLTPIDAIAKVYRKILNRKSTLELLSYGTTYGNETLRETLVTYLNETRGLNITKDNIIITRGSQMGMFLASQLLFNAQEYIIVGDTNYSSSDVTFQYAGAQILRVKVDDNGLNIDEVEALCKKYPIKGLYTTSHHHHPTTVTLSAERRMQLLNLAKVYKFAIIEDDYDYDFHYSHAPILPLASHDRHGNVIYVGSICKTVAPVYRVGYLVAPKSFVDECAKLRRYVDRQGDALLEMVFAHFISDGSLDRHIKKVVKIYEARRNLFCKLLKEELGDYITFNMPRGGMAIWATLNKAYSWQEVYKVAKTQKLIIHEWDRYDMINTGHNAIRIGFAAYNDDEIYEFIKRFKNTMNIIKKE